MYFGSNSFSKSMTLMRFARALTRRSPFRALSIRSPSQIKSTHVQTLALATAQRSYCATKEATEPTTEKEQPAEAVSDAQSEKAQDGPLKERDNQIAQLKKELMYALADAQNARKVAAEDVRKAKEFGIEKFAKDIVEVVDCLDGAVASIEKLDGDAAAKIKPVATGISMTLSVMMRNLERHGVKKIPLKIGDGFDYNFHEALYNYPIKANDTLKAGQVASIVKTGYTINTRILRASQVGVAQDPVNNDQESK